MPRRLPARLIRHPLAKIALFLLLHLVASTPAFAAEIKTITWPTDHAAPVAKLGEEHQNLLPLVRLGVSTFPESTVMQLTFFGGTALGLSTEAASSLHEHLSARYQEIENDKLFSQAPSALPYCYSPEIPDHGFATYYLPDTLTKNSPTILFLHGYGGSFSFYLHYLASVFPDHIIICPAYGISTGNIPSEYLRECWLGISNKLQDPLQTPVLIGLSAGGYGGFREYARNVDAYSGYICIAAPPPNDVLNHISPRSRIRLVAGANEFFVKQGTLGRIETVLKRRVADYASHVIPHQDHFFLLSAEETTREVLKKWEAKLRASRD